jgi:hypothetical protein
MLRNNIDLLNNYQAATVMISLIVLARAKLKTERASG